MKEVYHSRWTFLVIHTSLVFTVNESKKGPNRWSLHIHLFIKFQLFSWLLMSPSNSGSCDQTNHNRENVPFDTFGVLDLSP